MENAKENDESEGSASGSRKRGRLDTDDGKKGKNNTIGRLPATKGVDENPSKRAGKKKQKVDKEGSVAATEEGGGEDAGNAVQEQGKGKRPKNSDVILDGVNEDAQNRLLCHMKASHYRPRWKVSG